MFRSNGIFRDVLLYKTGNNSIYDFEAKISFKSSFSLDFLPSLKIIDDCVLTVSLYDDGQILKKSVLIILMFTSGQPNALIYMI